jgi:hypothetical protein
MNPDPSLDPDSIVRATRDAFRSAPAADDAELVAALTAQGVAQADRAIIWLPIAYGRRVLDGVVQLSPNYAIDGQEYPLAADPVFAAADRLARSEATQSDIQQIGLRSPEVAAVNQALNAGSQPQDLLLSAVTLPGS